MGDLLDKLVGLIGKKDKQGVEEIPRHVGIILEGTSAWAKKNKKDISDVYKNRIEVIEEAIEVQLKLKIPVLTVFVFSTSAARVEHFSVIVDSVTELFEHLSSNQIINGNGIRVSVFGKWYSLPGRAVEAIKKVVEDTKESDKYFLNFCINYSGQDEIVDACKILGKKIQQGKLDPDLLDKSMIRDEIYTSYFIPPDLVIKTGPNKRLNGFLLWDSSHSIIYFSDKLWPDLDKAEIIRAIDYYQEYK